ncbi:MAG: hypothetical protein GY765_35365, partial [bacterium]|nr:hypothetical protein [bacterium]
MLRSPPSGFNTIIPTAANRYRTTDIAGQQTYSFTVENRENSDRNLCVVEALFPKTDNTPRKHHEYINGCLFTDRDFYEPGDTVFTGGMFKIYGKSGDVAEAAGGREVVLNLKDNNNTICAHTTVKTDKWGGFSHTFTTGEKFKKGAYTITAKTAGTSVDTTVRFDYFEADNIGITIEDAASPIGSGKQKQKYSARLPRYRIGGSYLTGSPMAGGEIEYRVDRIPLSQGGNITPSPLLSAYGFDNCKDLQTPFPKLKGNAALDKNGVLLLETPFKKLQPIRQPMALQLDVVGMSSEGKEYRTTARTLYVPGNRVMGIYVPGKNKKDTPVDINLAVIDHKGRPSTCEAEIWIYKKMYGEPLV